MVETTGRAFEPTPPITTNPEDIFAGRIRRPRRRRSPWYYRAQRAPRPKRGTCTDGQYYIKCSWPHDVICGARAAAEAIRRGIPVVKVGHTCNAPFSPEYGSGGGTLASERRAPELFAPLFKRRPRAAPGGGAQAPNGAAGDGITPPPAPGCKCHGECYVTKLGVWPRKFLCATEESIKRVFQPELWEKCSESRPPAAPWSIRSWLSSIVSGAEELGAQAINAITGIPGAVASIYGDLPALPTSAAYTAPTTPSIATTTTCPPGSIVWITKPGVWPVYVQCAPPPPDYPKVFNPDLYMPIL